MKRTLVLLLAALLLALPASAHRRFLKYTTAQASDNTASGNTQLTELTMKTIANTGMVANCHLITTAALTTTFPVVGFAITGSNAAAAHIKIRFPAGVEAVRYAPALLDVIRSDGSTCDWGLTCFQVNNHLFVNGDIVMIENPGEVVELAGRVGIVTVDGLNAFHVNIDSSAMSGPWTAGGQAVKLWPAPVTASVCNSLTTSVACLTNPYPSASAGSTKQMWEMTAYIKAGATAGELRPIFTSNAASYAYIEAGSWCEYSYEQPGVLP